MDRHILCINLYFLTVFSPDCMWGSLLSFFLEYLAGPRQPDSTQPSVGSPGALVFAKLPQRSLIQASWWTTDERGAVGIRGLRCWCWHRAGWVLMAPNLASATSGDRMLRRATGSGVAQWPAAEVLGWKAGNEAGPGREHLNIVCARVPAAGHLWLGTCSWAPEAVCLHRKAMHRRGGSLLWFPTGWSLVCLQWTLRNWACLKGADRREIEFRKPC